MGLPEIAKEIFQTDKKIILIYGFNRTGKTRLSREYLHLTKKQNKPSGVYYNAFGEDIFSWDNDTDNGEVNIRLLVKKSRLNDFHSGFTESEIYKKLEMFGFKFDFKFNPYEDAEKGIESITFFLVKDTKGLLGGREEGPPIKISRGEERIFVWCFFLALFEKGELVGEQSDYFFIDDPVSSLDDHNIFTTALTLIDLIENHCDNKKIIITTHHFGLFSILGNRLTKGSEKDKYNNKTKFFVLSHKDNKVVLENHKEGILLYHLHLMSELGKSPKDELCIYHFVLLRQVLETIASFLGTAQFSLVLKDAGVDDYNNKANMINELSHLKSYQYQNKKMDIEQQTLFNNIFESIKEKYNFKLAKEIQAEVKK